MGEDFYLRRDDLTVYRLLSINQSSINIKGMDYTVINMRLRHYVYDKYKNRSEVETPVCFWVPEDQSTQDILQVYEGMALEKTIATA